MAVLSPIGFQRDRSFLDWTAQKFIFSYPENKNNFKRLLSRRLPLHTPVLFLLPCQISVKMQSVFSAFPYFIIKLSPKPLTIQFFLQHSHKIVVWKVNYDFPYIFHGPGLISVSISWPQPALLSSFLFLTSYQIYFHFNSPISVNGLPISQENRC